MVAFKEKEIYKKIIADSIEKKNSKFFQNPKP